MPRKTPSEEKPAGAPEWMLTYADTVTLLMTFFVLLMTFRTVDTQKFQGLVGALRQRLGPFKSGNLGNSQVPPPHLRAGKSAGKGAEHPNLYADLSVVEADFRIYLDAAGMADMVDFTVVE